jgi:predicted enzyme related to lactoylglutathione lyase
MGPMEIPGSGHMLMASDPTGAFFGVWQGTGHIGARIDTEPGTLAWSEVHTRDGAAADAFYRGLFGYELVDVGGGIEYTVWSLAGNQVAGRMTMGAEFGPEIPPHWMAYFAVDDADAAAERATQAGGQLAQGPFDSPYGRIAIIADPHGASFSAIDMSRRSAS